MMQIKNESYINFITDKSTSNPLLFYIFTITKKIIVEGNQHKVWAID